MIDRGGGGMMVRLVPCGARECRRAGSNRWIRESNNKNNRKKEAAAMELNTYEASSRMTLSPYTNPTFSKAIMA